MNRNSLLLALMLYLSMANGLENLCRDSHFVYKGRYEVNSVHRIQTNKTFLEAKSYIVDEQFDFTCCISGTYEVGLYEKLRADYNGIIFLLSESGSLQEIGDYRLRRYVENVKKLKKEAENLNKYQAKEGMRYKLDQLLPTFDRGLALVETLAGHSEDLINSRKMTLSAFRSLLEKMEFDERKEIFVFKNDLIYNIYRRPIKQDRFFFNRANKNFFDPDAKGVLQSSLLMPVHQVGWKSTNTCLKGEDLPAFFAKKMAK